MEIQARTGGELIIENVTIPYLKSELKPRIPIKFDRIVKIQNDNFEKGKNILFGVDIVKDLSESEVMNILYSLNSQRNKLKMKSNMRVNRKMKSRKNPCS